MTTNEKNNGNNKDKSDATTAQPKAYVQALQNKINGLETEIASILAVAKAKVDQLNQEKQALEAEKQVWEQDKQNQGNQSEADQKAIEEANKSLDNIQAVMVQMRDLFK